MTTDDAKDITEIILAAYPTQRRYMTADNVMAMGRAYYAGLHDIEAIAVKLALNRVVKSCKFLPTIAEIREAVVEGIRGPKKSGGDAWSSVLIAMRKEGAYKTPGVEFTFKDPLILAALKLFIWRDLCVSEDLVADRAHFIRHYDELAKGTRKETQIAIGAGGPKPPSLPPSNGAQAVLLGEALANLGVVLVDEAKRGDV